MKNTPFFKTIYRNIYNGETEVMCHTGPLAINRKDLDEVKEYEESKNFPSIKGSFVCHVNRL